IRKGEKISVKEVEDLIATHPAVAEVVVIPLPDPDSGERARAVVRVRPATSIDLAPLSAFLAAAGVANDKMPQGWGIRRAVPRAESGKILRTKLKERFAINGA